jgi:hypothetical protein
VARLTLSSNPVRGEREGFRISGRVGRTEWVCTHRGGGVKLYLCRSRGGMGHPTELGRTVFGGLGNRQLGLTILGYAWKSSDEFV